MRTKSKQKKPSMMEMLGLVDQQGKLIANPPKDAFDDFFKHWIATWGSEGQGMESPQTTEMVESIEAMNRAIKNALYGAISCSRLPVFQEICSEIPRGRRVARIFLNKESFTLDIPNRYMNNDYLMDLTP